MDEEIEPATEEQMRDYWRERRHTDEDDLTITPPPRGQRDTGPEVTP